MSIFSQVAVAFPYILILLQGPTSLITFWRKVSRFIQKFFSPILKLTTLKELQAEYKEIIAMVLFPFFPFQSNKPIKK